MESQVPIVNHQLTPQVSNQQREINLQTNVKRRNLFIMLRKLNLPNGTSHLQLLTIIFLKWMNCCYY